MNKNTILKKEIIWICIKELCMVFRSDKIKSQIFKALKLTIPLTWDSHWWLNFQRKRINHFQVIYIYIYIYIYIIIIIIMSCRQHRYPWHSLATSPYYSPLLAGLQGYIPYPHIAAVCMFVLVVLLLLGHMRGSIGVHHWWVRPCFSSSVLHVWFVKLV